MANRKARRAKKTTKEDIKVSVDPKEGIVKTVMIVGGIFILFYLLTSLITGQLTPTKNLDEGDIISTIQYNNIVAGETFNKLDDDYYVLFYAFEGNDSVVYQNAVDTYHNLATDVPLYVVNLDDGLNKLYISDDSNPNVQGANNLKIKGPTLIKINKGKNVLYVEGKDNIKGELSK